MTEFEKQMLAMMQELNTKIDALDAKVAAMDKKIDENHAVIAEGVGKLIDSIGDQQFATAEKVDKIEAAVAGLMFDVALLKRKVG